MCSATVLYITGAAKSSSKLQRLIQKDDIEIKQLQLYPELLTELITEPPDLVLLDCLEQGIQELTFCRESRKIYSGPLVLLSNQENIEFSILALKLGADVSLSLSQGLALVAANIQALIRRFTNVSLPPLLSFGNLIIDARRRDALLSGKLVNLSTIEFQVLWLLAKKSGFVVSRDEIHQELYGATYNGYDRNIDLYVSRIRQKIGDDPCSPTYLKTVRGTGYQFINAEESLSAMTV